MEFVAFDAVTPVITNFQSLCLYRKSLNQAGDSRSINGLPFQCTSAVLPSLLNHFLPVILLRRNHRNRRTWNYSAAGLQLPFAADFTRQSHS